MMTGCVASLGCREAVQEHTRSFAVALSVTTVTRHVCTVLSGVGRASDSRPTSEAAQHAQHDQLPLIA